MANQQLTTLKTVREFVESYSEQFSALGVKCSVTLKKFRILGYDGYKSNIRISNNPKKHSNYKVLAIRFVPLNSERINASKCREYSIRIYYKLNKIEKTYSDTSVLYLVEKLFNKKLKELQRSTPEKVCKRKWFDFFRYSFNSKYRYLTDVFGIKTELIDAGIAFLFSVVLFVVIVLLFR